MMIMSMLYLSVSENLYAEIGQRNASSPSPPPLPPPLMPDDLIDEGATLESNYQANVSVPSHLKWVSKRISRAADHDLAYLYEGHNTEFELPFYPKKAGGVTDVADSLYDDPTSLSLTPCSTSEGARWSSKTIEKVEFPINCTSH